jgi:hypothetical protein
MQGGSGALIYVLKKQILTQDLAVGSFFWLRQGGEGPEMRLQRYIYLTKYC